MQREINLLSSLPKTKRDVKSRAEQKTSEVVAEAKKFAYSYFDGDRKYGYGGLSYDGRWVKVAKDIIKFFSLKEDQKILDVGCAKGFLLYDLSGHGNFDLYGLDVSEYALRRAPHRLKARLELGTAEELPYKDKYFDLVISINTVHNLPRDKCVKALREIERVSKGNSYVVVDSYYTPEEKKIFEDWVLTAETHGTPEFWLEIFNEAGYSGFYSWNTL